MTRLISKLFNIRPAEWSRFLLLYLMLFLFVMGLVWGSLILEATFLKQVGLKDLPWFFIVRALISIPIVALYTVFADRVANDKLLIAILLTAGLVIVAGLVLLSLGQSRLAYWGLFLLIFPLDNVGSIHWFTYVNSFYNTQSAKRIIPVLVTSIGIANIVAGLTVPILNRFPFPVIILMWLSTLWIMALIAWLMPYLLKESKIAANQPGYSSIHLEKSTPSYLDNLREGYHYVIRSTYLCWLAISAFLLIILFTMLQYRTGAIFLDELKTEVGISNFTSQLTWMANLILLPIQLFLLNRLISRIGVGNAELIFPFSALVVSGGLIFAPNRVTAGLAYLDYNKFYSSIGYPIESLLFNAVPLRIKARTRAFISGLIVPLGIILGGLLLLLLQSISAIWLLSTIIIALVTAYVVSAWVIRQQYSKALITMLEQEDFSFLLAPDAANLTVTDPATLAGLRKKLEESTSYEFTVFIAKLISQIGGKDATSILSETARQATEARSRAAILDVLVAADTRGEAVRQLYMDFLADPDGRVRQAALTGLEELSDPEDKQFLELALHLVTDPDIEIQAKVLPPLLRAADPALQEHALLALDELLSSQDPHLATRGVHILRQTNEPMFILRLIQYLDNPADEVRLEAVLAVETLPFEKMSPSVTQSVVEKMARLAHDPVQRIRQAALVILGHVGGPAAYDTLVSALADPNPQIRTVAVDTMVQIGRAVIPQAQQALNSPQPQLRKMAGVVLSRVDRKEFGPTIETHVKDNLLTIYRTYSQMAALTPYIEYPGINMMQSFLREQNQHLTEEIFYLLAAIHDPGTVKLIVESLHSETAYVRANAVEALESLTTPHTARLIAPLFEPELPPARLLEIGREAWDLPPLTTTGVINQIMAQPDDPWLRALMVFALGEMGGALASPGTIPVNSPDQPASPPAGEIDPDSSIDRRRRPRSADLLDAITGPVETSQSPAEPKMRRPRPSNLLDALTGMGNNQDATDELKADESKARRPGDLLGVIKDTIENVSAQLEEKNKPSEELPTITPLPFTLPQIKRMVDAAFADPNIDVRMTARAASLMIAGSYIAALIQEEGALLSPIEKIIFLKEVPFFQGMTVDQLKVLANVCEEQLFEEDTRIFNQGDPGGALYVVVSGRVGIEQEKRKGSFARLATIEAHSYFGEMNLFDNSPRSDTAVALQDTLTLRLRREPLIALARQYPDLSLELINVLSHRLREANDRVAELTRTRPRELHKLFDKFD